MIEKTLIFNSFCLFGIFIAQFLPAVEHRQEQNNIVRAPQTSHCGPLALNESFKALGRTVSLTTIIASTKTGTSGFTSLKNLQKAARTHGFHAESLSTDYQGLQILKNEKFEIIGHFSENSHFIRIIDLNDRAITFYDSDWSKNDHRHTLPQHQFKKEWSGACLVISKYPITLPKLTHKEE